MDRLRIQGQHCVYHGVVTTIMLHGIGVMETGEVFGPNCICDVLLGACASLYS